MPGGSLKLNGTVRAVLAENPGIETEFMRKVKEDPTFAANPGARLEYFLRGHASWDPQHRRYPIFRVDHILAVPDSQGPPNARDTISVPANEARVKAHA